MPGGNPETKVLLPPAEAGNIFFSVRRELERQLAEILIIVHSNIKISDLSCAV